MAVVSTASPIGEQLLIIRLFSAFLAFTSLLVLLSSLLFLPLLSEFLFLSNKAKQMSTVLLL